MTASTKLQNFTHLQSELDPDRILYATDENGVRHYEEWRDIPEWEGYYQCSSFGRIKSLDRIIKKNGHDIYNVSIRILKQSNSQVYYTVGLKKDHKQTRFQVHQLVAICFLGHKPYGFKIVVDHKDNIEENNFVWNLQLVTNRHNSSKDKKGYTSKYVGVNWHKKGKKWRSSIYHNGRETHLGFFHDEKEASEYYQNALKAYRS